MKVILLQNVEGLGEKHDIKVVKDGYARNFLIPRKLAKVANKALLLEIEKLKEVAIKKAEKKLIETQKFASQLNGQEIEFLVKTGKEGQLFEGITVSRIIKSLKEKGFEIKKDQLAIDKPLKELGEFSVEINFDHQLEAKILIVIRAQGEKEIGSKK